jgi:hypothetical protein
LLTRLHCLPVFVVFCAITCLVANSALAQDSVSEFHNILREKSAFNETDLAALGQGQAVVRLLPVTDKREVAVCGMVRLQVAAEQFLQSFRESMTRKVNPAILEIGRFSDTPSPADLQTLTIENRDLEDLKECVVGDCKLKLSAKMIERLHKEIDWEAPDYRIQATQLLKQLLLDYVSDYVARGDAALIEYNDKSKEVSLAEEQRTLMAGSTYANNVLPEFRQDLNGSRKSELSMIESAIVWSKIKFGLKPVIAINHIMVYTRDNETGPQVLVTSKQIYANHYFDSSLALTAFVSIPDASPGSYLIYENRSRADALGGLFGKMKRSIAEDKAVDNLKNILESSKTNLNAQAVSQTKSASPTDKDRGWRGWKRWKIRSVHVFWCLLLITALVALFTVGSNSWKRSLSGGTPLT